MSDYVLHRHFCPSNESEYRHTHESSGLLMHEDAFEGHEHSTIHGIDEWVGFGDGREEYSIMDARHIGPHPEGEAGPVGQTQTEEDELQNTLGFEPVGVTYEMKKRKRINQHVGSLETLQGIPGFSSCIVCRCGWVMAYQDDVSAVDAIDTFRGHAQPGAEWITE